MVLLLLYSLCTNLFWDVRFIYIYSRLNLSVYIIRDENQESVKVVAAVEPRFPNIVELSKSDNIVHLPVVFN